MEMLLVSKYTVLVMMDDWPAHVIDVNARITPWVTKQTTRPGQRTMPFKLLLAKGCSVGTLGGAFMNYKVTVSHCYTNMLDSKWLVPELACEIAMVIKTDRRIYPKPEARFMDRQYVSNLPILVSSLAQNGFCICLPRLLFKGYDPEER